MLSVSASAASPASTESELSDRVRVATAVRSRDALSEAGGWIAALPLLAVLSRQPQEEVWPGLSRQYLHGTHATIARWTARKGAVVPIHSHPNEQMTWLLSGRAEVRSGETRYLLEAGDLFILPPNVPHEFRF